MYNHIFCNCSFFYIFSPYFLSEPVFVNLLRSPGIDSLPGAPVQQPFLTYRPLGYIGWNNKFLGIDPGLHKRLQIRALDLSNEWSTPFTVAKRCLDGCGQGATPPPRVSSLSLHHSVQWCTPAPLASNLSSPVFCNRGGGGGGGGGGGFFYKIINKWGGSFFF